MVAGPEEAALAEAERMAPAAEAALAEHPQEALVNSNWAYRCHKPAAGASLAPLA
jgi:hypothetical protein